MANKYYAEGRERAARVHDLFSTIAKRYDRINDVQSFGMHRFWKRAMKREAAPAIGIRALDLCCGTGDVATAMAKSGAEVVGLDFVMPMLEIARQRAEVSGLCEGTLINPENVNLGTRNGSVVVETGLASKFGMVAFVQGDATRIPFADGGFDVVTISYGLRNLADFRLGLKEFLRVLKPGGRLVILDFGKPENRLWRGIYFGYLQLVVPMFGRLFCSDSDAYAYILESLRHFPERKRLESMLHSLGYQALRTTDFLGGVMTLVCAEKSRP